MSKKSRTRETALVEKMANIAWQEYPGHFGGALSKALVDPAMEGVEQITLSYTFHKVPDAG